MVAYCHGVTDLTECPPTATMEAIDSAIIELKKVTLEGKRDKKIQDTIGHVASYLLLLVRASAPTVLQMLTLTI